MISKEKLKTWSIIRSLASVDGYKKTIINKQTFFVREEFHQKNVNKSISNSVPSEV